MIPEIKMRNFLQIFNPKDKIHLRVFKLFFKSFQKEITAILDALTEAKINVENLSLIKEQFVSKEETQNEWNMAVDGFTIRKDTRLDDWAPVEPREPRNDGCKRQKLDEIPPQEGHSRPQNVNKDTFNQNETLPNQKFLNTSFMFPKLQCKLCGLRFNEEMIKIFGDHIEEHRRKTNAIIDKEVLRRGYFGRSEIKVVKLDLVVSGEPEAIIYEKESPYCIICNNLIKKVWNDDKENWVLESGAKISEKEFAHRSCVI